MLNREGRLGPKITHKRIEWRCSHKIMSQIIRTCAADCNTKPGRQVSKQRRNQETNQPRNQQGHQPTNPPTNEPLLQNPSFVSLFCQDAWCGAASDSAATRASQGSSRERSSAGVLGLVVVGEWLGEVVGL